MFDHIILYDTVINKKKINKKQIWLPLIVISEFVILSITIIKYLLRILIRNIN